MDIIMSSNDAVDNIDQLIKYLETNEDDFYVAVDIAYQLREELKRVLVENEED